MVFYSLLDSFWFFGWTWTLLGVGCIFLVYAFKSNKQEKLVDRLPGPLVLPFFRNELAFFCNQNEIHSKIMKYSDEFGPMFRLWLSSGPVIVFSTAEYAQDVLLNTKFVYKGDRFRSCFGFFLGGGLLTAPVDKWKVSRRILQHSFHPSILHNYVDEINEEIIKHLDKVAIAIQQQDKHDMTTFLTQLTFGIFLKTMLGLDIEECDNVESVYPLALEYFLQFGFTAFFCPTWFTAAKKMLQKRKITQVKNTLRIPYQKAKHLNQIPKTITKNTDDEFKKFVQHFSDPSFSESDISDEITTMAAGATETIAVTVSFILILLAIHPEVQEKSYEEQVHIFGDDMKRTADYEDTKKMNYLEQVIKEVQRLFPLVPLLFREAQRDAIIKNERISSGTGVIINVMKIHKDEKYYPDPELFNPDRFSPQNMETLPKGAYIPFAIGPRNCIGKASANLELKLICSSILRKYRVHSDQILKMSDIKLKSGFVLTCAQRCPVTLQPRLSGFASSVYCYTDGSKQKTSTGAVYSIGSNSAVKIRLKRSCTIFTTELTAILFGLQEITTIQEANKSYVILYRIH